MSFSPSRPSISNLHLSRLHIRSRAARTLQQRQRLVICQRQVLQDFMRDLILHGSPREIARSLRILRGGSEDSSDGLQSVHVNSSPPPRSMFVRSALSLLPDLARALEDLEAGLRHDAAITKARCPSRLLLHPPPPLPHFIPPPPSSVGKSSGILSCLCRT